MNINNSYEKLKKKRKLDLNEDTDTDSGNDSDWKIPAFYPEKLKDDLSEEIKRSPFKRYIKNINLNNEISFEEYVLADKFIHLADIIRDDTSRKQVIKFNPVIDISEWKTKTQEWLYIFLIQDRIVKIGGTRSGLADRTGSYLCGHYTSERGGKDKCSVTNAYIYNTFDFYLSHGYDIKMMGYKIPRLEVLTNVFDKDVSIVAQTYHAYESVALERYKQQTKRYPFLSNNADPDYK
jgi:hypothetical protein